MQITKTEHMPQLANGELRAKNVSIGQLRDREIDKMYALMLTAYDETEFSQFKKDLQEKDGVFLLRDSSTMELKGFSTYKELTHIIDGKVVKGLFSGDTVIDKSYWRNTALGRAFLKHLFFQKLKNPFRPYYWYLISKGYKTYLMMANNFKEYYPRYDKETPPPIINLMNRVYLDLYGEDFRASTGTIIPSKGQYHLKENHDEISNDLINKNPKVKYFVERNPRWKTGTELVCVAKMSLLMPFAYQIKCIRKLINGKK